MSGPEEVEVLVRILADGVRAKMLRPKYLARGSWLKDSYLTLRNRVAYGLRETEAELNGYTVEEFGVEWARRVFAETCDVAAFGAMLADKASGRRVA